MKKQRLIFLMHKFLAISLSLVVMLGVVPMMLVRTSAYSLSVGVLNYWISNNTARVEGFVNPNQTGSITIPSSVQGFPVTSIANQAFNGSAITSVTIPNSVTSIGNGAFQSCSNLVSVNIPNGVTVIGIGTFSGCTALASITIPNSVTQIQLGAFGSSGLTSVVIPNSVTNVSQGAFANMPNLTSVFVGSGVSTIGGYAFSHNPNLTSVTFARENPPTKGGGWLNYQPPFFGAPLEEILVPFGTAEAYKAQLTANYFTNIGIVKDRFTATLGVYNDVTIRGPNQRLYYEFTPTASGFYTIESSSLVGQTQPSAWLYNSQSTPGFLTMNDAISWPSNINFRIIYHLDAGQKYYIAAGCWYTTTGSYQFRITSTGNLNNNFVPTPTTINTSATRSVNVTAARQRNYFVFTAPTAGTYVFQSTANGSSDPYGWLFHANGSLLAANDDGGEGRNFLMTTFMTANQKVYLSAGCLNNGTGSYSVSVKKIYPVRIIYDSTYINAPNSSRAQLVNDYNAATAALKTQFGIEMTATLATTTQSSLLNGVECPLGPSTLCSTSCGALSTCANNHHKGASRLNALSPETGVYTMRAVGHQLCRYSRGQHGGYAGLATMRGRNSIVTLAGRDPGSTSFRGLIQHELSHNFGAATTANDGEYHCKDMNAEPCVLKSGNYMDYWCSACRQDINANK